MEQLVFSLNATIPVFLVMVVGYILKQIGMLNDGFVKTLNSFNFKVTLPVLLFRDMSQADFYSAWDGKYVFYCFAVTFVSIGALWIGTAYLCKNKGIIGEFVQASYRSSNAVLGIAFIQNIYGHAGMTPLMILGSVPLYNIAAVLILSFCSPESKGIDQKTLKNSLKGIATNPIIWGILIGMLFSGFQITLPVILSKTVNNIAVLATPMALIGLGAGFEGRKAIKLIKPTVIASIFKLIALPCLFLPLAISMGFTTDKLVAILIMLGSPTTVSCYIMAKNMGHEGVLTSSVVVTTTFFSSITLTLFLFILRSMGLI